MFGFNSTPKKEKTPAERKMDNSEERLHRIIAKAEANKAKKERIAAYIEQAPSLNRVDVQECTLQDLSGRDLEIMLNFLPHYDMWVENQKREADRSRLDAVNLRRTKG